MANRYVAGASNMPFAVLRGYVGTELPKVTDTVASIRCPFTGEELVTVPALIPDVAAVHAQQADRRGNVALWGITGIQKEAGSPPSARSSRSRRSWTASSRARSR
jgi:glutaconate CoA-transferase subunit A